MDTVAALAAPLLVQLDLRSLNSFLGTSRLRVVQAHDGSRPFGLLLKALLHGLLGDELRCGRLDLTALEAGDESTSAALRSWVDLAGTAGDFPPPTGFYLLRGRTLLGYHPDLEEADGELAELATRSARGLMNLLRRQDGTAAGREALEGRPELELVRFFRVASRGSQPRRAPTAADRRNRRDRRSRGRAEGSRARRAHERLQSDLEAAFQLFGLPPDTPIRTVREVRNRLMRGNHPDLLTHAPERMAEATRFVVRVNEAWTTIRRARESGAGQGARA